jgi:hypothetical protein
MSDRSQDWLRQAERDLDEGGRFARTLQQEARWLR